MTHLFLQAFHNWAFCLKPSFGISQLMPVHPLGHLTPASSGKLPLLQERLRSYLFQNLNCLVPGSFITMWDHISRVYVWFLSVFPVTSTGLDPE